jgi:muramidase (phage lysozyme)
MSTFIQRACFRQAKASVNHPSKLLSLPSALMHQVLPWITLLARTVSACRRRQGAADLIYEFLISNGNVRAFKDLQP